MLFLDRDAIKLRSRRAERSAQYFSNKMTINVFIIYAHKDEKLKNDLVNHLAGHVHDGRIDLWHDRQIPGGARWREEIDLRLSSAHVVLILVSASLLASKFCWTVEIPAALDLRAAGVLMLPIIVRPCAWTDTKLGEFQACPSECVPVVDPRWATRDHAWIDVVRQIDICLATVGSQGARPAGVRNFNHLHSWMLLILISVVAALLFESDQPSERMGSSIASPSPALCRYQEALASKDERDKFPWLFDVSRPSSEFPRELNDSSHRSLVIKFTPQAAFSGPVELKIGTTHNRGPVPFKMKVTLESSLRCGAAALRELDFDFARGGVRENVYSAVFAAELEARTTYYLTLRAYPQTGWAVFDFLQFNGESGKPIWSIGKEESPPNCLEFDQLLSPPMPCD